MFNQTYQKSMQNLRIGRLRHSIQQLKPKIAIPIIGTGAFLVGLGFGAYITVQNIIAFQWSLLHILLTLHSLMLRHGF